MPAAARLRHTFASVLVMLGEDPAHVMGQLGHTDPAFTLRIYADAMLDTVRAWVPARDNPFQRSSPPTFDGSAGTPSRSADPAT